MKFSIVVVMAIQYRFERNFDINFVIVCNWTLEINCTNHILNTRVYVGTIIFQLYSMPKFDSQKTCSQNQNQFR